MEVLPIMAYTKRLLQKWENLSGVRYYSSRVTSRVEKSVIVFCSRTKESSEKDKKTLWFSDEFIYKT